ncbi:hypothetical protein [Bradyrhizobium sp.]|uniref:hypothetical protein n=1 Tax=Bradyrhizobium sp. TaxID=376 RepID=UPI001ED3461C|nr:hypothetical protein [Bradyrhizobium sp.]MBV9981963.1 hypothetical protein [Bradyrhizobium sp.]
MIATGDRAFAIVALVLSLLAALFCFGNFDELYWLNVILATAMVSGAALIGRHYWRTSYDSERTYLLYFFLMLGFWLVVWFWYADDFCPNYWMFVVLNAAEYAILCTAFYRLGRWREQLQPYALCLYLGLVATFVQFTVVRGQCEMLLEDAVIPFAAIPGLTLLAAFLLSVVWYFVLRHVVPTRWYQALWRFAPPHGYVVKVCPNNHNVTVRSGMRGSFTCPICKTSFPLDL